SGPNAPAHRTAKHEKLGGNECREKVPALRLEVVVNRRPTQSAEGQRDAQRQKIHPRPREHPLTVLQASKVSEDRNTTHDPERRIHPPWEIELHVAERHPRAPKCEKEKGRPHPEVPNAESRLAQWTRVLRRAVKQVEHRARSEQVALELRSVRDEEPS